MDRSWKLAVERLCKWRAVLTAWHLGSVGTETPGVQAMRDLQEWRLMMRAELSAITALLIEDGLLSRKGFAEQVGIEANHLSRVFEERFPGYRAVDDGIEINPAIAVKTIRKRGFPS